MINNKIQRCINIIIGLVAILGLYGLVGGLDVDLLTISQWLKYSLIYVIFMLNIWIVLSWGNCQLTKIMLRSELKWKI